MTKLTLQMIPKEPVKTSTPCILGTIQELAEEFSSELDLYVFLPTKGVNLQRALVWTLEQKQSFILSIIQEREIPTLSVNIKRADKSTPEIIEIIDGKQRICTCISFYNNEFPITIGDISYYFRDFDKGLTYKFACTSILAYQHFERSWMPESVLSDEDKINWFLYVNNTGTPQQEE